MRSKQVIIILIIAIVVAGFGYTAINTVDLKLPSHSDFRRLHGGGND